ncbi:MAG: DUF4255 domain-containing protein [Methanothrix sp.]|nr:DUF4255 domain-containing protein [Methanothrix sp.]MDD4447305.1 DUF4255 domain-containing protein [Methanothrix sp.]
MSNFLAIATVTEALRQLLDEVVKEDVSGATATAVRPASNGSELAQVGVNVYLYQASPNVSWRNEDLPSRREDGTAIQRPRAALDLHYLLNFYGDEKKLEPQRVMGSVLQVLHSQSILSRQQIQKAVQSVDYLRDSDLAEEMERVKFTPIPLSVEELQNLWSGLFQSPYSLSVAYQGSVIFIEGRVSIQKPLPVRGRNLYAATFRPPVIEQVMAEEGAGRPIVAGTTLVVRGRNLLGDVTTLAIDEEEISPSDILELQNQEIKFRLPSPLKRAGLLGLQVIHKRMMGSPPTPHQGDESNLAAFVLRPQITVDEARKLVHINPEVGTNQRLVLHLNEMPPGASHTLPLRARSFLMPSRNATISEISIPADDLGAGDYLVRVEVDGAESVLYADDAGNYIGPKVSIA